MTFRCPLRFRPALRALEARDTPAAGGLDPSFGSAGLVRVTSGTVSEVAAAPDGHILALVQGPFPSTPRVLRYNPDGTPDPAYGTNGEVSIPTTREASTLTVLPDGGALVGWVEGSDSGAWSYYLVRVTAAGTIDPTFGGAVPISFGSYRAGLRAVAVQPDGRILAAGFTLSPLVLGGKGGDPRPVVTRLTADGRPDPTFGGGGTVAPPVGGGAYGLAVQPDGRIVYAGSAGYRAGGPAAVRLTADGQLDPTFGTGGVASVTFPGQTSGEFSAVSVLPDGRILLGGAVNLPAQGGGTLPVVGAAARLTADGRLDPSYDVDGLAMATVVGGGSGVSAYSTAEIDPINRVVIRTTTERSGEFAASTVFRLTPGGTLDPAFGTNGVVTGPALPAGTFLGVGLAVQPNGDILLGGRDASTQSGSFVRLLGTEPLGGFVPSAAGTVTAGGATNGTLAVFNAANGAYAAAGTVAPFPELNGSVRSATADVTGDGTPDYVAGAGPGGYPQVSVFDGKTGQLVATWQPFESSFAGGVFVAAADLDGDGRAEVVVTPDQGGGPRVTVYSVAAGGAALLRANFFGIDDPSFRGGARPALGDVNGDGVPDLAVAAGFLGGPRTALFNGTTLLGGTPTRLVSDFLAFDGSDAVNLRNGVFVAVGDLDGDGAGELIFGGGPGGAPRVFALSGKMVTAGDVAGAQAAPVANFFVAGNAADRGGVRVGVADADADGRADLLAGSGAGSPARVRVYLAKNVAGAAEPGAVQDLTPFGGAVLADGVYVG